MENYSFLHLGLGWIGDHGGGLERYQNGICRMHASMGYAVEAWVQSRIPIEDNVGYQVHAYASPLESRIGKLRKLKLLARDRFENKKNFALISHHASVSAELVKCLRHVPHIVHFHGPWADESAVEGSPRWKTWLQRRLENKAYRSADRIITLSRHFASVLVDSYGVEPDRINVIPGGIDCAEADPGVSRLEARERLGLPKDRPIILSVRRLVRRVGLDILIEAIGKIVRYHPDLLVLIGGTGPLKQQLELRIKELNLSDYVRLLGFIPDSDLPFAYAAADYSVVPTQSLEGFGLVTIESLAAGTPPIVTPLGSLQEIANPLSENLVMKGFGAREIAASLTEILKCKTAIPTSAVCRSYVRANYDWGVIAPKVLNVYLNARRYGK